jgi:hypothetical protein
MKNVFCTSFSWLSSSSSRLFCHLRSPSSASFECEHFPTFPVPAINLFALLRFPHDENITKIHPRKWRNPIEGVSRFGREISAFAPRSGRGEAFSSARLSYFTAHTVQGYIVRPELMPRRFNVCSAACHFANPPEAVTKLRLCTKSIKIFSDPLETLEGNTKKSRRGKSES